MNGKAKYLVIEFIGDTPIVRGYYAPSDAADQYLTDHSSDVDRVILAVVIRDSDDHHNQVDYLAKELERHA